MADLTQYLRGINDLPPAPPVPPARQQVINPLAANRLSVAPPAAEGFNPATDMGSPAFQAMFGAAPVAPPAVAPAIVTPAVPPTPPVMPGNRAPAPPALPRLADIPAAAPQELPPSPIAFATQGAAQGENGASGGRAFYNNGSVQSLTNAAADLPNFNALNVQAAQYAPPASTPAATPHGGFADAYGAAAARAGEKLGVDPSVILNHWSLETGHGKSIIPGTNNLGNIKDMSGAGVGAKDNATGGVDKYRAFATPNDFADHYSDLLTRKYPGVVGAGTDMSKFAGALAAGGYAEDPKYAQKLKSMTGTYEGLPQMQPQQPGNGLVQVIKGTESYYTRPDGSDIHLYPTANGQLSEMPQPERNAAMEKMYGHTLQAQSGIEQANIRGAAEIATGKYSADQALAARLAEVAQQRFQTEAGLTAPVQGGTEVNPASPFAPGLPTMYQRIPDATAPGGMRYAPIGQAAAREKSKTPIVGGSYNAPDGTYGNVIVKDKKIISVK